MTIANLNQLEHLLALDETRHFAKAADRVHLSQPAFSRSIQSLERQTGMQLFERKGKSIKPTPAGHYLLERARLLVAQARSLERDMKHYQTGEAGNLAFGVGPFPGVTLAGAVASFVREEYPGSSIRIETVNPKTLMELLVKEDIEFYVADVSEIAPAAYLQIEPLMKQNIQLYARPSHPLAGQTRAYSDVWNHGLATVRIPAEAQVVLAKALGLDHRQTLEPAFQCDDVHLLCELALTTNTIAALTEEARARCAAAHSLVRLDVADAPPLHTQIAIVGLKGRALSPIAIRAIEAFRQEADKLMRAPKAL